MTDTTNVCAVRVMFDGKISRIGFERLPHEPVLDSRRDGEPPKRFTVMQLNEDGSAKPWRFKRELYT